MRDLILYKVDYFTSAVTLSNLFPDEFGENRVHINSLVALIKGGAARALEQMCRNADDLEVALSLNACPLSSSLYPERWNPDHLVAWYGRRGFRKVNTKNPLFSFMGRLMVRTPSSGQ